MTPAFTAHQLESAPSRRPPLPVSARIAVAVLVVLALGNLPGALLLLGIGQLGAGIALPLIVIALASIAIPGVIAFGITRRSKLAFGAGMIVGAYLLLDAASAVLVRGSTTPSIHIAFGLLAATILVCLLASRRALLSPAPDVKTVGTTTGAAAGQSPSETLKSPGRRTSRLVKIAAWVVAAGVGLYLLITVVAPLALVAFIFGVVASNAGPGSVAQLSGLPEASLRYPSAEHVSSGGREAEGTIEGAVAASFTIRFQSHDSPEDVITWYRDQMLPPRWVERGRGVIWSDGEAFKWCSESADAVVELVFQEPGYAEPAAGEYTIRMRAVDPGDPCFSSSSNEWCGFPDDTPIAWSGRATLASLGLGDGPDAERIGVASITVLGMPAIGGERAYCIEYGRTEVEVGRVPRDWQLPRGFESPPFD